MIQPAVELRQPPGSRPRDVGGVQGLDPALAVVADRVQLGDHDDGRGQAGEVGLVQGRDAGVGAIAAGADVAARVLVDEVRGSGRRPIPARPSTAS